MISYDPKSWWGLIFKFHRSDTFRILLPAMITVSVFSGVVVYIEHGLFPAVLKGTALVHSLLGFVISLLLVFRTNTAYERWWEGRRQWGSLVNTSRNIALKLNAVLPPEDTSRALFADLIGSYATILREHLRGARMPHVSPPVQHWPSRIASQLFAEVHRVHWSGRLPDMQFLALSPDLSMLAEICGACERIKRTPIPYSYSIFIKKFIFAYIVTLPFCFAHEFGYWTALFTTFVFYVFASLELIAEEIENPFGDDANDLPTREIAATISANAREILLGPTPSGTA
ncbi:MAG: bestrophin family ion channel [Methylotetracoccus sp.]